MDNGAVEMPFRLVFLQPVDESRQPFLHAFGDFRKVLLRQLTEHVTVSMQGRRHIGPCKVFLQGLFFFGSGLSCIEACQELFDIIG